MTEKRVWLKWWNGHGYDITYKDVQNIDKAWTLVKVMRKNLGSRTWFRITNTDVEGEEFEIEKT